MSFQWPLSSRSRLKSNVGVGTLEAWSEPVWPLFDELTAWPDEVATVAVVSSSAPCVLAFCEPQPVRAPAAMTLRVRAAARPALARKRFMVSPVLFGVRAS